MGKKEKTPPASVLGSKGILAGIIIIVVIIIMIGIIYASGNPGGSAAVPPEECGKAVILYVNNNIAKVDSPATLISVTETSGIYQIAARWGESNVNFYATKDCNRLFTGIYNLKANLTPTPASSPKPTTSPKPATSPTPIPEPVKSSRPSTELFVMSFCPFGVQAENAMGPVVDLLGTKSDIRVRFIATVSGDTVDSVKSLHGMAEAKEDLRQLCIMKMYPDIYWDYLNLMNTQCYPGWQNATLLASCQKNVTTSLDITNIETCATGSEGIALLRADEAITQNLKVTGSPTLIMNGQKYVGQRTAEAYKQAICARFETPPAECNVNLSAQAVAASSGSC